MLKLNFSIFYASLFLLATVFTTSCTDDLADESTESVVYSEDNPRTISILFDQDVTSFSEAEISELYFNASTGEKLNYEKNFLIFEALQSGNHIEKGENGQFLNTFDAIDNYLSILSDEEITNLESTFTRIAEATLRASCSFSCVTIPHPYFPWAAPITVCGYTCASNTVVLYEGNNGTQNLCGVFDAHSNRLFKFKWNSDSNGNNVPNDEARSMKMWNMDDGQTITVYDDKHGRSWEDDWSRITVNRDFSLRVINSFEQNTSNLDFTQIYTTGGNLDGKVSALRVGGN